MQSTSRIQSITILRWSLSLIFLWFGILKLIQVEGEAEDLAIRTVQYLTGGLLGDKMSLMMVGALEVLIGVGLLIRRWIRFFVVLLWFQLAGTLIPLVVFPEETWNGFLYPTIAGHYIIKNAVLIAAGFVLMRNAPKVENASPTL